MISWGHPFQNGTAHFKSGQPVLNRPWILNRAGRNTYSTYSSRSDHDYYRRSDIRIVHDAPTFN